MNKKRYLLLSVVLSAALSASAQDVDTTRVRVGYTQGNLQTVAGAVDKVGENRMNRGFVNNSLDALSGQSAGVQVQTGGNQEAMISAVRVRGTTSLTGGNDPLVIIDGVSSDLSTLTTIYPADIESFTILKDASETAQYGSRGAAGVIQVQTKKGKGERFHISYDGTVGFESIYKNVEMLNADQFRRAAQQLGVSIMDYGHDTNFRDDITRTGLVQNHHIAFGGGTPTSNYRASVGIQDHKTVIRNNRVRNYIAKLDVSQKTFDNRISFDLGVFGSLLKYDYLPFSQKLFYSAATFNPTLPSGRNADGSYTQVPEASWISNPNSLLDMSDDENNAHFNVHLRASADMGYGLTLTAFGSFTYNSIDRGHYYPTYVWSHGEAYRHHTKSETGLGNLSLGWHHDFKIHHVELLALAEVEKEKRKGFFVTSSYFNTDAFGYYNLEAGAVRPWEGTGSFYRDNTMESFLLRGQYTLLKRYTLTANARVDGSSKVGENNRWGFFPSVSAAWVVSEESWMKPLTWLNSLKLRAGYGRSGNLGGIDSYMSLALVQPNGIVSVNRAPSTTLGVTRNANPDLKWEVKRTFNIGLDATFWNKRIALAVDFYTSRTSDMLYEYDVSVPPFTYDKLLANLGKMRNHGLEIGFGITPLRRHDMELNINMNWTFERNKLVTLSGEYNGEYLTASDIKGIGSLYGAGYHGSSDVVMQIVGQPLGVFYLPHCNGLVKNADGSYSYDVTPDKQICGQAMPMARMGSNISFRFRQWDISIQANGAFGHKIYNGTALTYMNMLSLPNYNVMQGAPEANIQDQTISDYWLERGDYVNIDYLTLGWTVPLRSRYIQGLRLSASVNNLATITGYSGLTPMINSSVVNSTLGIDDKNTLPPYRSYTLAVSIQF